MLMSTATPPLRGASGHSGRHRGVKPMAPTLRSRSRAACRHLLALRRHSVYKPASRCAGEGCLGALSLAPPQRKTGRWNAGLAGGPHLVVQRKGCSFGMPLYEHTVIARPDLSTQQAQALCRRVRRDPHRPGRQGRQGRVLGSSQPVLPGQEAPQGPLSAPERRRSGGGDHGARAHAADPRGRAALPDRPRRGASRKARRRSWSPSRAATSAAPRRDFDGGRGRDRDRGTGRPWDRGDRDRRISQLRAVSDG